VLEVIGDTLSFAVGMLLSPFPVIVVLLILLSPTGTAGGVGFALGRLGGVALVAVVAAALAEVITVETGSSLVSAVLRIVLGVAMMSYAVVKWVRRPTGADDVPGWMSSVESKTPAGAAGLGFVVSTINPKELAFSIGAGLTIGGAGLPLAETVTIALGYTVIACLTVIVPAVAFLVSRDRVVRPLGRARTWLVQNNVTIASVVLLIIGSLLIGGGLGKL
jgi:hypothetical protein